MQEIQIFYRIYKIFYITSYKLKIFECVLVSLNCLNLYKINAWYISFILYGHHLKLCAIAFIVLLLKKLNYLYILRFFVYLFVYVLKYSLIQTFSNACDSNQMFEKSSGGTPDFYILKYDD